MGRSCSPLRRGARRAAQRLVLDPTRRARSALRHGLSLPRGRLYLLTLLGARRVSSSRKPCRPMSRSSSGPGALARRAARPSRSRLLAHTRRRFRDRHGHLPQPETDQRTKAQFTVSWMYDKQGSGSSSTDRAGIRARGEHPAVALEVFVVTRRRRPPRSRTRSWRSRRQRRPTDSSRSNQRARPLRLHRRHIDARLRSRGRSALLDFEYGLEIVRLTMAAYLSPSRPRRRPHRPRHPAELDDYIPLINRARHRDL